MKAIILAAGKGTRMKSEKLKVLHEVAGKPIVSYVLDTVRKVGADETFLVIGHQADQVRSGIQGPDIQYVEQKQQLGTGHAVMQVEPLLDINSEETIIVLAGDCPLIEKSTLEQLISCHLESNAEATILSAKMPEPASYGRILRGKMGSVMGIREAKDCTPEQLEIQEINTGVYAFKINALFSALSQTSTQNKQNEYYLTDVIGILKEQGQSVSAFCTDNADQAVGINTRMDLAKINEILYQKNNLKFMKNGVTIIDPKSTFIDSNVQIGHDTIIYPFTMIEGNTQIGCHCKVGPNSYLKDKEISDHSVIAPFQP